jgi:hypothetical protein
MSMAGRSRSRRAPSRLGRDAPPAEPAGGVDWAPMARSLASMRSWRLHERERSQA